MFKCISYLYWSYRTHTA